MLMIFLLVACPVFFCVWIAVGVWVYQNKTLATKYVWNAWILVSGTYELDVGIDGVSVMLDCNLGVLASYVKQSIVYSFQVISPWCFFRWYFGPISRGVVFDGNVDNTDTASATISGLLWWDELLQSVDVHVEMNPFHWSMKIVLGVMIPGNASLPPPPNTSPIA